MSLGRAEAISSGGERGRRRKRRELSEEQKQEIIEAFSLFDSDKDQAVDYHELKVKICINYVYVFILAPHLCIKRQQGSSQAYLE